MPKNATRWTRKLNVRLCPNCGSDDLHRWRRHCDLCRCAELEPVLDLDSHTWLFKRQYPTATDAMAKLNFNRFHTRYVAVHEPIRRDLTAYAPRSDTVENLCNLELLDRIISHLSVTQRRIAHLIGIEGKSLHEVAVELGIGDSSVDRALQEARRIAAGLRDA